MAKRAQAKKKAPKLVQHNGPCKSQPPPPPPYHISPPLPSLHPSGLSLVPPLLGRLKFRAYSHTHTEVSVKSAELHAFKRSSEKLKVSFFFRKIEEKHESYDWLFCQKVRVTWRLCERLLFGKTSGVGTGTSITLGRCYGITCIERNVRIKSDGLILAQRRLMHVSIPSSQWWANWLHNTFSTH